MIVRESPSPQKAQADANTDTNWPPKSALDALLSSPSRKKRVHGSTAALRTSPSPCKRRRLMNKNDDGNSGGGGGDEDDEETLQLKLQAIEARLKLKKLQNSKKEGVSGISSDTASRKTESGQYLPSQQPSVEVPSSPKLKNSGSVPQQATKRAQLGIDKGVRANDVSLKKPKSMMPDSKDTRTHPLKPQKSFSERLAESRSKDIARQEKQDRLQQRQTHRFDLDRSSNAHGGNRLNGKQAETKALSQGGRADRRDGTEAGKPSPTVGEPYNGPAGSGKAISNSSEATEKFDPYSGLRLSTRILFDKTLKHAFKGKELFSIPRLLKTVVSPSYEPPDVEDDYVVFGVIASKSVPRDHAAKHQMKSNADPDDPGAPPPKSKFMILRLTDLTWELDLFLFDSAFDDFWKITVGTVIAILNPGIMPPKAAFKDTGKFSLKLCSSEATLLEIGKAQDLEFCKSIKKDGQQCTQWIDGRKTEFCDFHVSLRSTKAKAGRMEINSMASLGSFGNSSKDLKKQKKSKGKGRGHNERLTNDAWEARLRNFGKARQGDYFDPRAQSVAYVIPQEYCNKEHTTRLLDAEDYVHGGLSKEERSRRKFAQMEKERELAKALGDMGSGLGRQYMRVKGPDAASGVTTQTTENPAETMDAASLGLVNRNAVDARLSPATKRRRHGPSSTAEPMGWSGAFKRGLLSPSKNENTGGGGNGGARGCLAAAAAKAERIAHDIPKELPTNKRARFFIEQKGIRMPGRESDGHNVASDAVAHVDNDDDLDIIY